MASGSGTRGDETFRLDDLTGISNVAFEDLFRFGFETSLVTTPSSAFMLGSLLTAGTSFLLLGERRGLGFDPKSKLAYRQLKHVQ